MLCSPKTQRIASTTLLFPQPLGPTKAVIPLLRMISVLSANDLKPSIVTFFNIIFAPWGVKWNILNVNNLQQIIHSII
ncbi:MAG: hypothetical protein ACD_79C00815G0001 [uncultured bacterium]|nr:MAG: hypothetical protein ACD_79C00815G0001 [uncultured bacterium]